MQPWLWKPHLQAPAAAREVKTQRVPLLINPRAAVARLSVSVLACALSACPSPRSAPLQVRSPARELRALPEGRAQVRVRLVQRRGQVHAAAALRRGPCPALARLVQPQRQVLQPSHHRGKSARLGPLLLASPRVGLGLSPSRLRIRCRPCGAEEWGGKGSAAFCEVNVRIRRHAARVGSPLPCRAAVAHRRRDQRRGDRYGLLQEC